MPAQSKIDMLEKVNASLDQAQGLFVVDYRGLSVKEAQEVRRALRDAGAQMKVYKNNIVKIALKNADMPNIDDMLSGTCAYVFYDKDPVEAAKVLKDESKKLNKMEVLGGIVEGKAIDADTAKAYADLPSRDQLIAQLVFVMASPLSGIAQVCAGPARGLVTALSALKDQKEAA
ncbi:MAG: 50S ribosomal protein L10 [Tractidigestivibacter sp.]|jgi:large subunit ribosomal protein L10|uniref:50S ribosomal protein L10 n=1 Tax=Tractidigestivibacter sp. TaxID=2847320 RepID=UPI003D8FD315